MHILTRVVGLLAGWRPRISGLASDLSARFPSLPMRTLVHSYYTLRTEVLINGVILQVDGVIDSCIVALAILHYAMRDQMKLRVQLAELLHAKTDRHLHGCHTRQADALPYPPRIGSICA